MATTFAPAVVNNEGTAVAGDFPHTITVPLVFRTRACVSPIPIATTPLLASAGMVPSLLFLLLHPG